ncbi:Nn.00g039130.m01.CDS01 [Neocucurbitaria sp. VM-36]
MLLFSCALTSLLCSILASPVYANALTERSASTPLPFGFAYAFTAHLTLGEPLPPIAIPGGVLITEPIINGTVSGAAINATITGGIATPSVYENGTLQVPAIQAWGITSDGFGVVINELGVGVPKGQVTRIQLSIGGGSKYAALRNGYVLATVDPNSDQTKVAVQGYLVDNAASYV